MEFRILFIDKDGTEEIGSYAASNILDAIQQFYIVEGVRNIISIERTPNKKQNIYDGIYKVLSLMSNKVGEKITEYHWREFCGLMKIMEDEKMIKQK